MCSHVSVNTFRPAFLTLSPERRHNESKRTEEAWSCSRANKSLTVCVSLSLSLSSSSVKLDHVPVSQPVTTKCQPIQTVCSRLLQRWEHTVPSWHHFDSRDVVWHTSALMKIVMTRKPQIMKHLVITLCYINAHDDTQFPWKTIYTGIIWYIMHQHVPSFLPMTVPLTCDIKYSKCLESF